MLPWAEWRGAHAWCDGLWRTCFPQSTLPVVTLQQVCQAEQQVRARLPGHMRLVLLQVGDVGKVLFGRHLVQELAINFVPGMWAFRLPVDFHAGEDDLGCGGGGGVSTEIVLVMAGPCRGQIWVVSRREDGFSVQPLCTSPWADACPLPASVPDIMRVLAIACWERVAGADPAAFGTV